MEEKEKRVAHPYIPNSVPEIKEELLKEIGIESTEDIFGQIPEHLRLRRPLNIPKAILSEYELKKHVTELLSKNKNCEEYKNYLGRRLLAALRSWRYVRP